MGFLDGIFETKASKKKQQILKPVSTEAVSRATGSSTNPWTAMGAGKNKMNLDKAINSAYERVIWVFRCVDAIASNQANIPMYKSKYTSDTGVRIEDKLLNRLLNRKTNPFEDSWTFRYRLSSILLLSPVGAFIELVRNGAGDVVEMYILDPGSVDPIKDDKKWVSGYKVKRPNNSVDILSPEQIIWLKLKAHPLDVYSQMTALIPTSVQIETDILARIFNKNFLKNDGRPGMLIGIDGDMSTEDAEELRNLFSGGYAMAGQTRVIESENIHVVDLSSRPRDVQWDEALKSSKEDILEAFGVPESVLGNASGRCLRVSEKVYLSDGTIRRADELVGQKFKLLQPTFDQGQIEVYAVADYAQFETIYKITTFSGRTLETNAEHPLFMATSASKGPFKRDIFPIGWTPMKDIKNHYDRSDSHYKNVFTEVAVPIAFEQKGGEDADYDVCYQAGEQCQVIPDYIFTSNTESQIAFLSGLYSKHGLLSQHTSWDIYVPTKEYATKLQRLLQRIGVHSSIGFKKLKHIVSISGKINMFNFLSQLDLTGDNATKAKTVWDRLSAETSREHNALRSDGLPPGLIWDRIYSIEEIGQDQTVALTVQGDHTYLSGFWEHNTYNNADAEEENFWTKTMIPHCESIARNLEPLTGDDQDETYITFDYDTVDILQRIKRRKQDAIKQDFAKGIKTLNEVLKAIGEPEIDSPYARVYFHTSRLIGGVNPMDVEAVRRMPVIGSTLESGPGMNNPFSNTTPTGGDGTVGGFNDMVQGELAGNGVDEATQTVNDQAARTLRSADTLGIGDTSANPNANVDIRERIDRLIGKKTEPTYEIKQIDINSDPYLELRSKMQGLIEGHLDSWSDRQLKVAQDRINHVKVRKGTRHWDGEPGTKSLDTSYVIDVEEWAKEAHKSVLGNIYPILLTESHKIANNLQDLGKIKRNEGKTALELLLGADYKEILLETINSSAKQIFQATSNQSKLAAKHIGNLDASGKSIKEIQDTLVDSSFDRSRWSRNLARMVTTNSIESLCDLIYSKINGNVYKIWCSGAKEHYREGHGALHGTKKKINEKFDINGVQVKYPTDQFNDEAFSCSCWILYGIDD